MNTIVNNIRLTFDGDMGGGPIHINIPHADLSLTDERVNESMDIILSTQLFRNSNGLPIRKRAARLTHNDTKVIY